MAEHGERHKPNTQLLRAPKTRGTGHGRNHGQAWETKLNMGDPEDNPSGKNMNIKEEN